MASLRHKLEHLYDEYAHQFFLCALSVTKSREMAEDAVQEAFCRLLQLEIKPQNLKAYVFKCIRNAAVDQLRKINRLVPVEDDSIFETSSDHHRPKSPREIAELKEFTERVDKAMGSLSPDEREVVIQHLYSDLTFQEIADIRETPLSTVSSWYRRGVAKLRDELEV